MWIAVLSFILFFSTFAHASADSSGERVITLAPVLAEWSAEILGKKEALKQIVGVSEYSDYPAELKSIPTVGPYPQLNIEKIASLKPTLVIASSEGNRPDQIEKLRRLKLKVEVLPAERFDSMESWIKKLAAVLGNAAGGDAAAKKWSDGVAQLKKGSPKRVFVQVQESPIITVGGDSFLNEAFARIGYQNVFAGLKQGYPKVSREAVLKENPDLILIMDLTGHVEDFKNAEAEWKKFKGLKAVTSGGIQIISGDDYARCSLRLLNALKQLCCTKN